MSKGFGNRQLPRIKSTTLYVLRNCENNYYVANAKPFCDNWTSITRDATKYRNEIQAELAMYEASRNMFCCTPEIVQLTRTTFRG